MENQDTAQLLAQLKDIHLPEAPVAPSLWPLYVFIVLLFLALGVYALRRSRSSTNWQREALDNLADIQQRSPQTALQQTAILLKRIAITHDNHPSVKRLSGDRWLQYLDQFYRTDFFSKGEGQVFGDALYRSSTSANNTLYKGLKRLIKRRKWQR